MSSSRHTHTHTLSIPLELSQLPECVDCVSWLAVTGPSHFSTPRFCARRASGDGVGGRGGVTHTPVYWCCYFLIKALCNSTARKPPPPTLPACARWICIVLSCDSLTSGRRHYSVLLAQWWGGWGWLGWRQCTCSAMYKAQKWLVSLFIKERGKSLSP